MKKIKFFLLVLTFALSGLVWGQTMNDVYEYNRTELLGTARYMGTAGSISNVGADLSGVSENPAGAAYFLTNRFSFTPEFYNIQNTTDYNGEKTLSQMRSIYRGLFFTNQAGLVLPFISGTNDWNKISVGFNYNKIQNYNNSFRVKGQAGSMQSIQDYFVINADGVFTDDLTVHNGETVDGVYQWLGENYGSYAQHAFLAYQTYLIDPVSNNANNTQYTGNAIYSYPLYHDVKLQTGGKKFSTDFFIAGEYKKKMAVGFSLVAGGMERTEKRTIIETGYDTNSEVQGVKYTTVLKTDASGIGVKVGLIYKLNKEIKLSFAYHSPVWWEVNESTREGLKTEILDINDIDGDSNTTEILSFDIQPGVQNTYDPYRFISPGKITAGFSAVIGKYGFISLGYAYKDWAATRFMDLSESGDAQEYYDLLNEKITQTYTAVHQWRVGGEFKVDDWFLRGGFLMKTSPFKNDKNLDARRLSFGVGYDFGKVEVDFALVNSNEKYTRQLFPVGLTEKYQVQQRSNHYALSIRYNF